MFLSIATRFTLIVITLVCSTMVQKIFAMSPAAHTKFSKSGTSGWVSAPVNDHHFGTKDSALARREPHEEISRKMSHLREGVRSAPTAFTVSLDLPRTQASRFQRIRRLLTDDGNPGRNSPPVRGGPPGQNG